MKRKTRFGKVMSLLLSLVLVIGVLPITAFATSQTVATDADDVNAYTYYYNGYDVNISPYYMSGHEAIIFRVDKEDLRADSSYTVNTDDAGSIDKLGTDYFAAYCCDVDTYIQKKVAYKRINLENAGYYDADTAAQIRAILENGYWPGEWTLVDAADAPDAVDNAPQDGKAAPEAKAAQDAANTWLAAQGKKMTITSTTTDDDGNTTTTSEIVDAKIIGLTNAEALSATQGAIWSCANKKNFNYSQWNPYKDDGTMDFQTVCYDEGTDVNTSNNINLFMEYLMTQDPVQSDKILFSDDYVVSSDIVFTEEAEDLTYNITLKFKLQGTVGPKDILTLAVTLGDDTTSYSLTGVDAALTPDSDGYYSLDFTGISAEDAAKGISMNVSGTQNVNGVYFYQAQPQTDDETAARDASQNLVGKFSGNTDVNATQNIALTTNVMLTKYNASEPVTDEYDNTVKIGKKYYLTLSDATFDLYAVSDKTDKAVLVKSSLTTDEHGEIMVEDLLRGYTYYFKETSAPEGFVLDGRKYHYVDSHGEVLVGNYKPTSSGDDGGNSSEKIDVSVEKVWNDNDNAAGVRPESVTVQLLKNGKVYKEVKLNEDNDWSYTWENLSDNYSWKVQEVDLPDYYTATVTGSTSKGYTITNKYGDPKVSISGQKTWVYDGNDTSAVIPATITVNLLADGEITDSTTVKADQNGDWKYSFTGLPKYDHGKEIVYTVQEVVVEGFTATYDGYNITNTYTGKTTEEDKPGDDDGDNIPDGGTPGSNVPDNYDDIPDGTPLGSVPKTGDISGLWLALTALCGAGLLALTVFGKKREYDI